MKLSHSRTRAVGLGIGLLAILCGAVTPLVAQSRGQRARTILAGTVIPVKLDQSLSSKTAQEGDTFTATVANASAYRNATALPVGTKVDGVIRAARAKESKRPGMLDLAFNRVTLPDGRSYSISGTPIALDSKSVTMKGERLVAKAGNKGPSRMTYVGIGAGAGLLANVLGHRKGTLTDVLVGAGLGYGAGSLIKSGKEPRDVNLKDGTTVGVSLTRDLALARR